jgi:hypothetical protein
LTSRSKWLSRFRRPVVTAAKSPAGPGNPL